MAPTATASPTVTFQGIDVPAESVNPAAFFALTRRHRNPEYAKTFAGLGGSDAIELRKSDIISGVRVRFSGTITIVGTTVKPTMRWPYDLVKAFRFTANGQSNLINASGCKLKVREFARQGVTDRGVSQTVGAATVTQGTLSKASEEWGVAPNVAATAGTYDVELEWLVPICEDEKDLAGSIFAQTSTMDLVLNIDWNTESALFTGLVAGTDTEVIAGKVIAETEKYSIPVVGGNFVVPDLSLFHSLIETRASGVLSTGENELRLIGQGAGKQLLRVFYQIWNGTAANLAPLLPTEDNYGPQSWRYGTNETPETYQDGRSMRQVNEDEYGTDIGAVWGFMAHEFAVMNAFRDTVDMGQTSELRLVSNIDSSVTLSSAAIEYVQETMFAAGS